MKRTALFLALLTLALALLPGCTQEEEPADAKPVIYLYPEAEADGTDLVTAQKAYGETLEGWGNLSEAQQADEAAWFALKVAPYDKGLQYARLTEDRALFEAVLASR